MDVNMQARFGVMQVSTKRKPREMSVSHPRRHPSVSVAVTNDEPELDTRIHQIDFPLQVRDKSKTTICTKQKREAAWMSLTFHDSLEFYSHRDGIWKTWKAVMSSNKTTLRLSTIGR